MSFRQGLGISIMAVGEGNMAFLSRIPFSWRGMAALVLGVLLAQWSWVLFAPLAPAIAPVAESGAAAEAGRLFGEARSGIVSVDGVAITNVRLVGVFAADAGKPGFAVLKLDDKHQVGVAVGGTVAPGTKLLEVHPDYVLLERAGVQQRVNMESKVAGAAGISGAALDNRVQPAR